MDTELHYDKDIQLIRNEDTNDTVCRGLLDAFKGGIW